MVILLLVLIPLAFLAPEIVLGQQGLFTFVPHPIGATGGKFEVWLSAPSDRLEPLYSLGFTFDNDRISRIGCDVVATGAAISLSVGGKYSLGVPLPPGALQGQTYVVALCNLWFRSRQPTGATFDLECDRDDLDPQIDCEDGQLIVGENAPQVCDGDSNRDRTVDIVELVRAVGNALGSCKPDSIFAPSVSAGE